MREVQEGLWHWEARHPEWTPESTEDWGPEVSSYAIDDGERLLLFDPLAAPSEIEELAASRETAIVLTCPWHERDARSLVERLGARVFVPPPEEHNDDVAWLRGDLERLKQEGRIFSAGDRLPVGVEIFPGMSPHDLVLWVESRRALVAGDTLIDRGNGLELPADWLREGQTRDQAVEALRPLLELPVELVLPTHGRPTDRAALERALS
ncbi:MAG: MBL fold metallo-hydrolase [Actinomycetota bacterium]|nr:MBL fold metallo-hydrolase [Actinomycetota bacterium]